MTKTRPKAKDNNASRRHAREQNRKPRFYAVAVGYKPGIYKLWSDAAKQVQGYSSAVYKSFPTWEAASEFMRANQPPSIHTPLQPAPQTANIVVIVVVSVLAAIVIGVVIIY